MRAVDIMGSVLMIVNGPPCVPHVTLSSHWQYRESHRVEYFDQKYSGSIKITTHLDHISHCEIILVIVGYKLVGSMDPPSILSKHSPRFNRLSRVRIVQLSRSWVDCHTFLGLTCWVSGKHLSTLARGRARVRQIDQIHFPHRGTAH